MSGTKLKLRYILVPQIVVPVDYVNDAVEK